MSCYIMLYVRPIPFQPDTFTGGLRKAKPGIVGITTSPVYTGSGKTNNMHITPSVVMVPVYAGMLLFFCDYYLRMLNNDPTWKGVTYDKHLAYMNACTYGGTQSPRG